MINELRQHEYESCECEVPTAVNVNATPVHFPTPAIPIRQVQSLVFDFDLMSRTRIHVYCNKFPSNIIDIMGRTSGSTHYNLGSTNHTHTFQKYASVGLSVPSTGQACSTHLGYPRPLLGRACLDIAAAWSCGHVHREKREPGFWVARWNGQHGTRSWDGLYLITRQKKGVPSKHLSCLRCPRLHASVSPALSGFAGTSLPRPRLKDSSRPKEPAQQPVATNVNAGAFLFG
jgi:hypothetical protein